MVRKMDDENKYRPPKPSAGDAAHAIVRAGLSNIPYVGVAASELLSAIVIPPLERRRNEWMKEIGEALRKVEAQKGIALEALQEKEEFIDVVIEATQIAIKATKQEKREALKNAILNSALPNSLEESLQKMFLSFIDTLTVWHLRLLDLFNDPPAYIKKHNLQFGSISMGAMSLLVENAFPELQGRRNVYDLIWKDLYSRALVNTDGLHTMMTRSGILAKRTTEIGELFLGYIKSPLEEQTTASG